MDFSSLTETQQQQQQQEQQQSYHPAQSHAYDAYYSYQHHHYAPSAAHYQYYYPNEYAATYHHHHHPAAAAAAAADSSAMPAQNQGAGAHGVPAYAQGNEGSYPAPPGLNPAAAAAVAALSQLTELAGTMDAAERAMVGMRGRQWRGKGAPGTVGQMVTLPHHPYQYPTQHGGMRRGVGGRRGGGQFRGGRTGGRANLGQFSQGPGGAMPLSRGRGRGAHVGRGGGRRFHQSTKPSVTESESAETQESLPAPSLPRQPRLPIAWCDICRVDCNSLEILEQHKNGKRHKKTVQRYQEIQAHQKLLTETQTQATMQGFDGTTAQPQHMAASHEGVVKPSEAVVQVAKENMIIQEGELTQTSTVLDYSREASGCENTMKSELQHQVADEQKVSAEKEGIIYLPPAEEPNRGRPPKRKMMKFGQGDKRFRYFRPTLNRPQDRPKVQRPKEQRPREQPRVCTLCNVMCETKVVFDSHIAGKKHISRIKRFQGEAVYGPVDVYNPPTQPSVHNPPGLQPLFFGLKTQDMINLAAHERSSLMVTYGPHLSHQGEPAVSVPQMEQVGGSHSGEDLCTKDRIAITMEVEGQSALSASEVDMKALSTPGDTIFMPEPVHTKDAEASETSFTTVEDAVDGGTVFTALECTLSNTGLENVVVEAETAFRLIEHVATEAEAPSEIENAIEAEASFATKGVGLLEAEAAFAERDTFEKEDTALMAMENVPTPASLAEHETLDVNLQESSAKNEEPQN